MYKSPFLNEIRDFMLVRRYSKRTIKTYITWIRAYINFNEKQHPSELGAADIERFLTHLAVNRTVSASTQSLALNALAFLYNKFLEAPIADMSAFRRAKRQAKLPTVLTQDEMVSLLRELPQQYKLLIGMLYGSGLRRIELKVKGQALLLTPVPHDICFRKIFASEQPGPIIAFFQCIRKRILGGHNT